ncbi:MAG: BspA family leucine-rich repeat surface protein, partial [Bacteroidaceae bacterium]|nr:BspA family leucine-rich repeat surface protein [Bacteroidaceae bacterium]
MKKVLAWLLVLSLTAAISIGATLAYLTDTDEDVNVMTLGKVKIDQLEYERVDNETADAAAGVQKFHDNKPLLPAVTDKDFTYTPGDTYVDWTQIGKDGYTSDIWDPSKINNEVDKMVFVKNKGNYDAFVRTVFAFEAGNYTTLDQFKSMVHLNLNTTDYTWEWVEAPVEIPNAEGGTTKYFVATATYNKVLAPGALTEISLCQVALDKTATNEDVEAFGETYQILVKSQGIQADGFEAPAAALNEGFGLVATNLPWENDNPTKGGALSTALHYLNADPAGSKITTDVTNIVFGKEANYPEIVNHYEGYLIDVEQDAEAYAYYVENSRMTKAAPTYTIYVLSDDVIYAPKDSSYLFCAMSNLEAVNVEKMNTSRTVNMTEMFQDCAKLKSVDASTWDTSSLVIMDRLFNQCSALQTVNTTGWDLRNVTSAERSFRKCVALQSVPGHENWVLSSAQSVYGLFATCEKLTVLDASKWDFGSLVNARDLFYGCIALKEIQGMGNWDTRNIESLWDTFGVCKSLETLEGLQNWNVSKLTKFAGTFQQCVSLTDEDVAVMYDWKLDSVTDISWLFKGATGLVNIDLSKWDVSKVTAFNSMFSCVGSNNGSMNLVSAGIENWDTSSATHMGWMFMGCGQLTSIDLSNWNTDNLIHAGHMFADCFKLETVNFGGWTAPKLQTIDAMFNDCRAMKVVDMSDFTMESCIEFSQTFEACWSLEKVIGMENWDTSKGCTFVEMFNGCSSLKELNWSSFDTSSAYDRYYDMNNSYSNAFNPIFSSVNSLEKLIVSDKISYYGNGNVSEGNKLVFPNPVAKEGYTAKWQNVDTKETYLAKDIPEGVAATYVPCYVYEGQGATMNHALHYLNADPNGTKITTKVSNIIFGRNADYAQIVDTYTGALADHGQELPVYAYYVPLENGCYDVYILAEGTIYAPADCTNLCSGMTNLVTFSTDNLDMSRVTTMRRMFSSDGKLQSVDADNWDTSKVTSMNGMFMSCQSLQTLDVSDWDTSEVTDMYAMFYNCKQLPTLDVSDWNVGNVTNMEFTFGGCEQFVTLD